MKAGHKKRELKRERSILQTKKLISVDKITNAIVWAESELLKDAILDASIYDVGEMDLIKDSLAAIYIHSRLLIDTLYLGADRIRDNDNE